ncbi:hypothetical protein GCM10009665_43010 [Kitasatospora nipponensis]|uniref:Carrier domain-containing protein n=1 Tax=Kitasatospora nipponensis TaxID=258049 RepID=A0ABP4H213_9ACTN
MRGAPAGRAGRRGSTGAGAGYRVVALADRADAFADFLGDLYRAGARWRWERTAGTGRRIELPSYRFQRIRCWLPDAQPPAPAIPAAPAALVPTDPSGRRAAPADALDGVMTVWRDVLGLESVDPEVSFFDLGGDSINGLQVMNRLRDLFDVELDEYAIFDHDTPRALAELIDEARAEAAPVDPTQLRTQRPAATPAPESEPEPAVDPAPFDASPAQLPIWLAAQFEGGSVAFNLTRSLRLTGALDAGALARAVDALAARHDALRAVFSFTDGRLRQRIRPAAECAGLLEHTVLTEPLPAGSEVPEPSREFAARPFDLAAGPLLRVQLLSSGEQHLLTLCTHHLVADGWSLQLLVRDLGALYARDARPDGTRPGPGPVLPPPGIGYRDHLVRQEQHAPQRRAAAAAYWLDRFAQVPTALDLPVRPQSAEAGAFSGAYRGYRLSAPLWARLKEFAQQSGVTPFGALLGAFAAVLARFSEHGELVLGTSVAGRGRAEVEQTVGMLVRTVPLRLTVDAADGFAALVDQVRGTLGDALRHLDHPYEELVQDLRQRQLIHGANLFDVLIEFEQFAGPAAQPTQSSQPLAAEGPFGPDLRATPLPVTLGTSVFPLNIMLAEVAGTLEGVIRYDTRLLDAQFADGLWEALDALLTAVLDRPQAALGRLPLLSEDEQLRVRTLGHREFAFDPALTIHRAIERTAALDPGRPALSCGPHRLGYGELNARANRLARYFADGLGVRPGAVVALVMDRSILMVESILALWKCGAAYLPLDPKYPAAFVRSVLDSSGVELALVDPARLPAGAPDLSADGCRTVELTPESAADRDDHDLTDDDRAIAPAPAPSDQAPAAGDHDSALAYVIYTSGSTGAPKGAMVEHLGMLNHLHAKIQDLAIDERSVVVQNASNSFDISVWQMFAALFAGGRTVIIEESEQLQPLLFAEQLAAEKVTVLEVVPSYLDTLLDSWERSEGSIALESLQFLLVTGEAVLPQLVNRWLRAFPATPVVNAYGPTEASDDITHHLITKPVTTDSVPLGRPIHNTLIYVLDEHLRICPPGVRGEIHVSGIGVGRGYLHAPEQSARAFGADPFAPERRMYRTGDGGRWTADGVLEYLGRTDSQVKVRGYRIDLGEVEHRVSRCPGVRTAVVTVGGPRRDRLCAYVLLEGGSSLDECRAVLTRELPQHMVPTDFVEIDRVPLTPNGKIDRRALQRSAVPAPSALAVPPSTATELALAEIWQEVLGLDRVGVTDRFFDLGGNSLRAVQILSRIRSRLGVAVELEDLFARPTIAALARQLPGQGAGGGGAGAAPGGPGPGSCRARERRRTSRSRPWAARAATRSRRPSSCCWTSRTACRSARPSTATTCSTCRARWTPPCSARPSPPCWPGTRACGPPSRRTAARTAPPPATAPPPTAGAPARPPRRCTHPAPCRCRSPSTTCARRPNPPPPPGDSPSSGSVSRSAPAPNRWSAPTCCAPGRSTGRCWSRCTNWSPTAARSRSCCVTGGRCTSSWAAPWQAPAPRRFPSPIRCSTRTRPAGGPSGSPGTGCASTRTSGRASWRAPR